MKKMPSAPKIVKIGTVGVDSGSVAIADPTYLSQISPDQITEALGYNRTNPRNWKKYAALNFPNGISGLGVVSSSGYGDGSYPVYAKIIKDPTFGERIESLTIQFITPKNRKLLTKLTGVK